MAFTLVLGAIGLPPSRDFFYTGVTRFPHPRTLKAYVAIGRAYCTLSKPTLPKVGSNRSAGRGPASNSLVIVFDPSIRGLSGYGPPRSAPLGLTEGSLCPEGPERKLGPTGPAERHGLALTGTVRIAVAMWTPVQDDGYDSAFGSSLAWTQAPWAGGEVVLWTVFPVGMWPIRPSPGT